MVVVAIICLMFVIITFLLVFLYRRTKGRTENTRKESSVQETSLSEGLSSRDGDVEQELPATPTIHPTLQHQQSNLRSGSTEEQENVSIPQKELSRLWRAIDNLTKERRHHRSDDAHYCTHSLVGVQPCFDRQHSRPHPHHNPPSHSNQRLCPQCIPPDELSRLLAVLDDLRFEGRKHHPEHSHYRAGPDSNPYQQPVSNHLPSNVTQPDLHPHPVHQQDLQPAPPHNPPPPNPLPSEPSSRSSFVYDTPYDPKDKKGSS